MGTEIPAGGPPFRVGRAGRESPPGPCEHSCHSEPQAKNLMGTEIPETPKTVGGGEIPRLRLGMTLRSMAPSPSCHSEPQAKNRAPQCHSEPEAKNLMGTEISEVPRSTRASDIRRLDIGVSSDAKNRAPRPPRIPLPLPARARTERSRIGERAGEETAAARSRRQRGTRPRARGRRPPAGGDVDAADQGCLQSPVTRADGHR